MNKEEDTAEVQRCYESNLTVGKERFPVAVKEAKNFLDGCLRAFDAGDLGSAEEMADQAMKRTGFLSLSLTVLSGQQAHLKSLEYLSDGKPKSEAIEVEVKEFADSIPSVLPIEMGPAPEQEEQ